MKKDYVLILDNIRSVENVASIFRTAESLGVLKIILVGITPAPVDRFGRKRKDFSKVSLGTEDTLEWRQVKEIGLEISRLRSLGFKIIALEQDAGAIELGKFKSPDKFALIAGNEVNGISQETLNSADSIVEISLPGQKESLNVSVAVGVAIFNMLK